MKFVLWKAAWKLMLFLLIFINATDAASQPENSPVGYWKTIDDVTGKPKAIVQILEENDQTLSGRIIKIFPRPGYDQNARCTACKGKLHNQRIVGLIFLKNLKKSKTVSRQWIAGDILDPKNGKIYRSSLTLSNNAQKVNVRGYIGLPLFGRTQIWIRLENI
ncbi:MAG TPA: DUF2147 domain-containing protein [Gammaproteobacteria bacterium]|nr:DUF2147 domain-containing protein [Gammaproteobacteria bacterium]